MINLKKFILPIEYDKYQYLKLEFSITLLAIFN